MEKSMLFKELVKEIRMRCLISQKELAEWVDTDQTSISYYEMGKRNPTLRTMKKMIDVANKHGMNIKYTDIQ
jgi:DNA-binding XRE family transcriptional regulator